MIPRIHAHSLLLTEKLSKTYRRRHLLLHHDQRPTDQNLFDIDNDELHTLGDADTGILSTILPRKLWAHVATTHGMRTRAMVKQRKFGRPAGGDPGALQRRERKWPILFRETWSRQVGPFILLSVDAVCLPIIEDREDGCSAHCRCQVLVLSSMLLSKVSVIL